MSVQVPIEDFGGLLKYLRKRAHLTQRDLAQAVGYTEAHVCRLEKNERLPDLTTVAALFIPALDIKDEPELMERLLKLAAEARDERQPAGVRISQVTVEHLVEHDLGALEEIPAPVAYYVERAALTQRVQSALTGERCVGLCGIPGNGKTALAATVARAETEKPVFWHTFIPNVNTNSESIVRQLALFLWAHGQTQVLPLVENRGDASPMPFDQQLVVLRAALAAQPSLLCFDDVHFLIGHENSLKLLHHLISTTSASLLLTSRQNLPLPLQQINLEGLEVEEARELVTRLGVRLDAEMLERLLAKTDYSPMLLRLAVGQMLENHTDAHLFLDHLETQPQVASYLLRTVLNDLAPPTQWLAKLISIFRQSVDLYDEALLESIERLNPPGSFEEAVRQLQNHYLVEDTRHAALHPLVRDHLYATLAADSPLKKRLHRLAAEWYEQAVGNVVEAAHHWMNAGDLEQASEILSNQSESLFNQGEFRAAVEVVDEVLRRVQRRRGDTTTLKRLLLTARGNLLHGTFRAAEAESSYREALALAQGLPSVRARIVSILAQILMQRGQPAEAYRLCHSAAADLSSSDTVLLARLVSVEARAHLALSQYDEAERLARQAIDLTEGFAELMPALADDVRARAERTLGWINYTRHPEGAESLVHYRRALECARRAGLKVLENAILSNTGTALMERGDLEEAQKVYQEAFKGYESLGDMYGAAGVLHNLGVLHAAREEIETALLRFEQASEIERRIGDREGLFSTDSARASILLGKGRVAEARRILDAALIEGRESSDIWTVGTCLCLLSEVQLAQGELDNARASAERVLAMAGIKNNARIRSWAQSDLALIHIAAGKLAEAQAIIAPAPPNDLGSELTTRWQLVQCATAVACGDREAAAAIADTILERANQHGLKQLAATAQNLMAQPAPTTSELPLLILANP